MGIWDKEKKLGSLRLSWRRIRCRKPMKQDNGTGDKEQVDQLDEMMQGGLDYLLGS